MVLGPLANTLYHLLARVGDLMTCPFASINLSQGIGQKLVVRPQKPVPIGVHGNVERLVIEKLRCPLGCVDLGDLGRHYESGDSK